MTMMVSRMTLIALSKSINHSVSPWWREVRGGNLEKAMRVLKKKVQKEGIVRELKERQYYRKPSEIKREAKKQGIKNVKKKMAKLERMR